MQIPSFGFYFTNSVIHIAQVDFALYLIIRISQYKFCCLQNIVRIILQIIVHSIVRSIVQIIVCFIICFIVHSIIHSIVHIICRIYCEDSIVQIIVQILLCKFCYIYWANYRILRSFNFALPCANSII